MAARTTIPDGGGDRMAADPDGGLDDGEPFAGARLRRLRPIFFGRKDAGWGGGWADARCARADARGEKKKADHIFVSTPFFF
jgi:hypothetical protein